jgi:hypothetical protein
MLGHRESDRLSQCRVVPEFPTGHTHPRVTLTPSGPGHIMERTAG